VNTTFTAFSLTRPGNQNLSSTFMFKKLLTDSKTALGLQKPWLPEA